MTKDYVEVINTIKSINYKWWKKDNDNYKRIYKEEVYEYKPVVLYNRDIWGSKINNIKSNNNKVKISVLDNLELYDLKNISKYNHLLAINEEILEYIVERTVVEQVKDKEIEYEMVDILIFLHLYLNKYHIDTFRELKQSIPNLGYKYRGFEFRYVREQDLTYMQDLYLYIIHDLDLYDIMAKVRFNSVREDHKR